MKTKLFTAVLLFLLIEVTSISQAQNCTVPPAFAVSYEDDINALAVQYMLSTADSDQIAIPQIYHDDIAAGMAAIFNSGLAESDSVFNLYCIHAPYLISLGKEWLIGFDSNYTWTTAWQNTQTVTGNQQVDTLFAAHSLYVDQFFPWSFGYAVLVKTTNNATLNSDALADSLNMIPGVIYAEPNALIGTAGQITFSKGLNNRHYEFTYEWNDCFDGCDNSHTWKFDVDTNCNVTFAGSSYFWALMYDPLPLPTGNCLPATVSNLSHNPECLLYPNPFSDFLNVKINDNQYSEILLYNILSEKILQQEFTNSTVLNTRQIPKGMYVYELRNKNGTIQKGKIIKQ